MTFDMEPYAPWVSALSETSELIRWGLLTLGVALVVIGVIAILRCCRILDGCNDYMADGTFKTNEKRWKKHKRAIIIYATVAVVCVPGGVVTLRQATPDPRPVSVSSYLNEQAAAQTNDALTNINCQTPQFNNISNDTAETAGRYPCSWRFDGKTINGTVSLSEPKSGHDHLPRKATLLDSHGDAWCPTDWKTADGCKPITK